MNERPRIERIRHQPKRRMLTVARIERIGSQMTRVVLSGAELADFISLGFDDHVKLFFPGATRDDEPDTGAQSYQERRDFTPRRFDAIRGELWIDFFLHEAGPATAWAARANVGESLEVGGPRSSMVIAVDGIDFHVFIGDETALPAICRRLEELPPNAKALAVIETEEGAQLPPLTTAAALEVIQVFRDRRIEAPGHELIDRLRATAFPAGRCFVWVACESKSARAIRRYLLEERGMDKSWVKAAGYWQRGTSGEHESIGDD